MDVNLRSSKTINYHLYVHAPWCRTHCPLLRLHSLCRQNTPFRRVGNKDLLDWDFHKSHLNLGSPKTIYFGGGTPSIVPIEIIRDLLSEISESHINEITLEVNPGDVTPNLLVAYRNLGITRVSLGIQTFNRSHLKRLGRASTPRDAQKLLEWVSQADFNSWSVDIMFGLPNQTLEELQADVETILKFNPPHISLYGLTFKAGTPYYFALQKGTFTEISEDLWVQMFSWISTTLINAGYERYEVSNFCKPPHQAQHNEGIWKNQPYIGLGPGAHGFWPSKYRTYYPPEWKEWISKSTPNIEIPEKEQQIIDWIITAIRHKDGIDLLRLQANFYTLKFEPPSPKLDSLLTLLHLEENRIRLSDDGWIMVDWITDTLLEYVTPMMEGTQ